jgi:hypothetical protein
MLSSGKWDGTEESVQYLINALKKLDETVSGSRFNEYMKKQRQEIELIGKSPELKAIESAKKALESVGLKSATEKQVLELLEEIFNKELAELEVRKKLVGLSEEQLRLQELIAIHGNKERSETISSLEKEINFLKIMNELKEESAMLGLSPEETVKLNVKKMLERRGADSSEIRQLQYIEENGKNILADLTRQLKDAGKSTYELTVERLMIERSISKETAQQAISVQKQIDYITNGYDWMGEIMTQIDDALRSIRAGEGGYGQYAGGRIMQKGMDLVQGSDVGNFIEGFQQGGIWGALIETLVGALAKVIGGMEEMEKALNPITTLFQSLGDIINFLHEIIMQIADGLIDALKPIFALIGSILQSLKPLISEMLNTLLIPLKDLTSCLMPLIGIVRLLSPVFEGLGWIVRQVFDALRWFLNAITFGLIDKMNEWADTIKLLDEEQQKEADRLKAINDQYKNLLEALKEQEEYYLQQRRHLNSQWAIENFQAKSVNDMIITPSGAFSTDPKDYIIATKHPETLTDGASPVYVTVINNANATVTTEEKTTADGAREVQITVENIVQNGLAKGKFDSALDAVAMRKQGKRITA